MTGTEKTTDIYELLTPIGDYLGCNSCSLQKSDECGINERYCKKVEWKIENCMMYDPFNENRGRCKIDHEKVERNFCASGNCTKIENWFDKRRENR